MSDALKNALYDLLAERGPAKSICPSDVARRAYPDTWRSHMAAVHALADQQAQAGTVKLLQKGKMIDPADRRGVYRIAAK
ncbi:MAG: DUF3253 domain-containing protein [Pseudomonadota bacterium]